MTFFPNYFSRRSILLYLGIVAVVLLAFSHPMTWYWYVFGIVEVGVFFHYGSHLSKKWHDYTVKRFEKNLFWTSLAIRVAWVLFSFWFFFKLTGTYFDLNAFDVTFYHDMGQWGAHLFRHHEFNWQTYKGGFDADDVGYPLWLSLIYLVTNDSILAARLVKAVLSSLTVLLLYRLASRNFGDATGRLAGIFCMLMPNLIYYCGVHLKETEMVFLCVLFVERGEALIRSKLATPKLIIPVILSGCALFFFRMVLFAVAFLSIMMALVFSSSRIIGWGRKILVFLLMVLLVGVGFGSRMMDEVDFMKYDNVREQQETNMNWRAERKNGNTFAKYAGASVFAPLIFTIPFPTMVKIPDQEHLNMIHGGNYAKNIMSFFTIIALLSLLLSGNWTKTVLPAAFMCGYLVVLIFSQFAQSERFHMVAIPFLLMYAAYGVANLNRKQVKWFSWWMVFIFAANVGWQWFKLKGRGMI